MEPLDFTEAASARREKVEVLAYYALDLLLTAEPDADELRAAWEWLHCRLGDEVQPVATSRHLQLVSTCD